MTFEKKHNVLSAAWAKPMHQGFFAVLALYMSFEAASEDFLELILVLFPEKVVFWCFANRKKGEGRL